MDLRPSPPATLPPHLVFSAGARWFGIPAESASEVMTFPALTAVPGGPSHLLGLFSHRGEIIPVVDFSYLDCGARHPTQRAILMRVAAGVVALTVGEVIGVSPVSGSPARLAESGFASHLLGPAQAGEREVALVEPDGLFAFLSLRPHGPTP